MSNKFKHENGAPGVETFVAAGSKAAESFVKASTEAATQGYERFFSMGKENVEAAVKAGADAFKSYGNVGGLGKENVEAVAKSSAILAKGIESISSRWFELAKASFDESVAASKALMACKSVKDVVDVQGSLVRTSIDKVVSESAAITEMSVKVANEALAPISGRVNAAIETFAKPAA
ncbi:MAG: phasin family protein [Alphaproteobacteria bacterium]